MTNPTNKNTAEDFWLRVQKSASCWEWTGKRYWDGYGSFNLAGRRVRAHRLAWELHNRQPIPKGMLVCHRCDNPPCCNPEHLFLGTQRDNVVDMHAKGRGFVPHTPGERSGTAKLTVAKVATIRLRLANGEQMKRLAAEFGVSGPTIGEIAHGRSWRHVDPARDLFDGWEVE